MTTSHNLERFHQIDFNKIIDHPNILIAANFWDTDRFQAARICYKFMRAIDDMIDNYKAENKEISVSERKWFENQVKEWLQAVKTGNHDDDPLKKDLITTIDTFRIPHWTLEDFAKAMLYDIDHDGFETIDTFINYSQGASVAPSSIFVHLCGISRSNGTYNDPVFDVREAAKPCALFSYLVHIIRDFQKDQFDNLSYFADSTIIKYGLTRELLSDFAHGTPIPQAFRDMIREYVALAEKYRIQTLEVIDKISPFLEAKYQLSLNIIYNLYDMVYKRIDVDHGQFTSKELNPDAEEVKERVLQTILDFENAQKNNISIPI
ncbi:MAG: squalene/phytoene synthase family protein [Bacteroidetes bacterium]|nr:squalene/phytoene synthase family protein [Bacteroidota bacterium]